MVTELRRRYAPHQQRKAIAFIVLSYSNENDLLTKEPGVLLVATNLDWGKLAQLKRSFAINNKGDR